MAHNLSSFGSRNRLGAGWFSLVADVKQMYGTEPVGIYVGLTGFTTDGLSSQPTYSWHANIERKQKTATNVQAKRIERINKTAQRS